METLECAAEFKKANLSLKSVAPSHSCHLRWSHRNRRIRNLTFGALVSFCSASWQSTTLSSLLRVILSWTYRKISAKGQSHSMTLSGQRLATNAKVSSKHCLSKIKKCALLLKKFFLTLGLLQTSAISETLNTSVYQYRIYSSFSQP